MTASIFLSLTSPYSLWFWELVEAVSIIVVGIGCWGEVWAEHHKFSDNPNDLLPCGRINKRWERIFWLMVVWGLALELVAFTFTLLASNREIQGLNSANLALQKQLEQTKINIEKNAPLNQPIRLVTAQVFLDLWRSPDSNFDPLKNSQNGATLVIVSTNGNTLLTLNGKILESTNWKLGLGDETKQLNLRMTFDWPYVNRVRYGPRNLFLKTNLTVKDLDEQKCGVIIESDGLDGWGVRQGFCLVVFNGSIQRWFLTQGSLGKVFPLDPHGP